MLQRQRGSIKIILAIIVVVLLFAAYTQFRLSNDSSDTQIEDSSRVVDGVLVNPNDQEVLDDLERAGTPFQVDDPDFSRTGTGSDVSLLPTKNYTYKNVSFKYPPVIDNVEEGDFESEFSKADHALGLYHSVDIVWDDELCLLEDIEECYYEEVRDISYSLIVFNLNVVEAYRAHNADIDDEFLDERINLDGTLDYRIVKVGDSYDGFVSGEYEGEITEIYVVLDDGVTLVIGRQTPSGNGALREQLNLPLFYSLDESIDSEEVEKKIFNTFLASIKYNE